MSTTSPNLPAYKSQAGPIQLTSWANEQADGSVTHNTYLLRSYRVPEEARDGDEDDGWRKTNSLRKHDLLVASEMLKVAYVRLSVLEFLDNLDPNED